MSCLLHLPQRTLLQLTRGALPNAAWRSLLHLPHLAQLLHLPKLSPLHLPWRALQQVARRSRQLPSTLLWLLHLPRLACQLLLLCLAWLLYLPILARLLHQLCRTLLHVARWTRQLPDALLWLRHLIQRACCI